MSGQRTHLQHMQVVGGGGAQSRAQALALGIHRRQEGGVCDGVKHLARHMADEGVASKCGAVVTCRVCMERAASKRMSVSGVGMRVCAASAKRAQGKAARVLMSGRRLLLLLP